MARAPAAKKSRPSASRSGTTSASPVKAKKKTGDTDPDKTWTAHDQELACAQGWRVIEVIDGDTHRLFFEVVEHGPRFEHGGLARMFVMEQNKAGDELAIKALRIVFVSKAGTQSKAKK